MSDKKNNSSDSNEPQHPLQRLFYAIGKGDVTTIEEILDSKQVKVDEIPLSSTENVPKGFSALHMVAMGTNPNCYDLASVLIKHGADTNLKAMESQQTPLFFAAFSGSLELAQLLVEHGADPHVKDSNEITLLHCIAQTGKVEMAKFFIEDCKVSMDQIDKRGWLPYHTALR
jgi:palmitoyltransferase